MYYVPVQDLQVDDHNSVIDSIFVGKVLRGKFGRKNVSVKKIWYGSVSLEKFSSAGKLCNEIDDLNTNEIYLFIFHCIVLFYLH